MMNPNSFFFFTRHPTVGDKHREDKERREREFLAKAKADRLNADLALEQFYCDYYNAPRYRLSGSIKP